MSWGLIAAGVIAAVGGVVAANEAGDASRDAARTAADAANRNSANLTEEQRRNEGRMEPYVETGRAADRYINAFLGLPPPNAPTLTQAPREPTEAQLMAMFPEHAAYWRRWEAGTKSGDSLIDMHPAHAKRGITTGSGGSHRAKFGSFAGYLQAEPWEDYQAKMEAWHAANNPAPTAPPQTTLQDDRAAAEAAYAASPWAKFARESADAAEKDANERFMSNAGARGSVVSGRTARGLYEVSQEAEDKRFREGFTEGYYPSLTGVSTRGYNATVGVGDSALTVASLAGAAGERAGVAEANGELAEADARATGINSALYYGGQVADAWRNRPPPPPPPPPVNTRAPKTAALASSKVKYAGG